MYRSSPFRSTLNTSYITGLDMCEVCTEAVHSAEPENDRKLRNVSGKKSAANMCCQAQNVGFWIEKSLKPVLPSTKCCQNSVTTSVCTPQCPQKHAAVCGTLANYLLLAACYLLLTTCCLLLASYYLLLATC